jgi:hypothetical protein
MNKKREARREKFRKLGQALSRFVSDPLAGLCQAHPWRVKNSGGFQVMQIVADPGMSRLEKRSLEIVDREKTAVL